VEFEFPINIPPRFETRELSVTVDDAAVVGDAVVVVGFVPVLITVSVFLEAGPAV